MKLVQRRGGRVPGGILLDIDLGLQLVGFPHALLAAAVAAKQ